MPKGLDLIAERAFFVNGKRKAVPLLSSDSGVPTNLRRTIPGVDMS
jgi:hypothetical protein